MEQRPTDRMDGRGKAVWCWRVVFVLLESGAIWGGINWDRYLGSQEKIAGSIHLSFNFI